MRKTIIQCIAFLFLGLVSCHSPGREKTDEKDYILAEKPPMGWNSWICFGTSVTEQEVKENADFMAENLKDAGWEYLIIDAGWYAPGMDKLNEYESKTPNQLIDEYGRLIIDTEKHPSAKNNAGLKPLSDYVHAKGLKLGIHIMRGIPIQAVEKNTPIKGTSYTARDIANTDSQCLWYFGFYGVDMTKPGAQEYYDSLFELYASWGIDYVKADDLLSPIYAYDEIEAIASAAKKASRPILLSLSPGPAPVENAKHLESVSQLWRISEDFWDNWESLKLQFPLCRKWQGYGKPGHWPDADMLPIGPMAQRAMRGEPRNTNFTVDEQYTMFTLWCIFRSPLMLGCNLPEMDDFTKKLITDKEVLAINQSSKNNKELYADEDMVIWYAQSEDETMEYVAIFNLDDVEKVNCNIDLKKYGITSVKSVVDMWNKNMLNIDEGNIPLNIPAHGVRLVKINNR